MIISMLNSISFLLFLLIFLKHNHCFICVVWFPAIFSKMPMINIYIKYKNLKNSCQIDNLATVLELRQKMAIENDCEPKDISLVYQGKILKDPQTLESYCMLIVFQWCHCLLRSNPGIIHSVHGHPQEGFHSHFRSCSRWIPFWNKISSNSSKKSLSSNVFFGWTSIQICSNTATNQLVWFIR